MAQNFLIPSRHGTVFCYLAECQTDVPQTNHFSTLTSRASATDWSAGVAIYARNHKVIYGHRVFAQAMNVYVKHNDAGLTLPVARQRTKTNRTLSKVDFNQRLHRR